MFVFIIPRVPIKMRNSLRDELWEISKKSLLNQTSKNWKAIIIGDTKQENLNSEYFITLDFDDYSKKDKIKLALDFLKDNQSFQSEYLIRFDDDDIFSKKILLDIERLPNKYDCYYDEYHVYLDSVYLKLSHKKNSWIPNTAIHKYEHAITPCGKDNIQLLMQSHNEYWHIYYQNKNVFKTQKDNPLYFRNLTPFSLTSYNSNLKGKIDWGTHLKYLKGYGPWINLSKKYFFYYDLKKISNQFFVTKPDLNQFYWFFNWLKFIKKNSFFI